MNEAEAYRHLTSILCDVFERDDLEATPELTARDVVGWDSFKQVEILIGVEEATGIAFTPAEAQNLRRLGDIARIMMLRSALSDA